MDPVVLRAMVVIGLGGRKGSGLIELPPMSRSPSTFRQQDVTRFMRAARKAGYTMDKAVINRSGDIVLVFGTTEINLSELERNPWDEVLIDAADEKRSS